MVVQKTPSPVVLFVYNRPKHTEQTVEALKKNELASETDLFIFSDGPKTEKDEDVEKVREYIKTIVGFKSVVVVEKDKNIGLANSIISGVSDVLEKFEAAIVLEDDIFTSPDFLRYMNDGLEFYKDNDSVMSITGYAPEFEMQDLDYDTFFFVRFSCWGWATWKDEWKKAAWDDFDEKIKILDNKKDLKMFKKGGENRKYILDLYLKGYLDSWAARFDFMHFYLNKYCVYPFNSLVLNIGLDGSGVHCGKQKSTAAKSMKTYDKFKFVSDPVDQDNIADVLKPSYKLSFKSRIKYFLRLLGVLKKVK